MAEVACESQFRHFGKNGKNHSRIANAKDVGVMQINEQYHGDKAETLGLDIYSLDGNLIYASYLYKKEGTKPVVFSKMLESWIQRFPKTLVNHPVFKLGDPVCRD